MRTYVRDPVRFLAASLVISRSERPTGAVFGRRAAARTGSPPTGADEDAREPAGRSGFPRSLIFGGFRRKRSSIVSLCSLCSLWLISFAGFVRDPRSFLATHLGDNRALFQWQARTPAVDADVDPPKRKRPPILSLRSLRSLRLKILRTARPLVNSPYFALDKIA